MRTLKLTIAYEGTRYAGWQIQKGEGQGARGRGRGTKRTVQGTLEQILRRILRHPVRVLGSGRTDAGVHALAQVAHMTTRSMIPCDRLRRSVNQLLPEDIVVSSVEEIHGRFHARFDASRKQYRYRIVTGPVVTPFVRRYAHHVPVPLNLARMRRETASLLGRHDFRSFAKSRHDGRSTARTIVRAALCRRGDELHLDLEGDGFLHTMVRSIAGTLIDIGRGRLPEGTMQRLLRSPSRALAGTTAPARGLMLMGVIYQRSRRQEFF